MADSNSFHYDQKINNAFQNFNKTLTFSDDLKAKYGNMLSIFDTNGDNALDTNELKSLWNQVKSFAGSDNTLNVDEADKCVMDSASGFDYIGALFTRKNITSQELFDFLELLKFNIMPKEPTITKEASTVDMKANIAREAEYRGTKLTKEEIDEWNKVIIAEAKRYNVPPEVLTVIISRECHFIDPNNKDGCMQVIPSSVNGIKQDKWGIYNIVNQECRNDTVQSLKTHNLSDRSTGIKAGLLIFQTNYAQAVAKLKGWYAGNQPDIEKAANGLKDGSITLTPSEAKEVMRMALRDYNGSKLKESYASDCIERLDEMGYDYSTPIF
ncbi:MAG: hypothetical protein NC408_04985 [Candidatus Gastranaerophilales bacterium]|nr:hypothetical protein [Candidatus Gastranaerophilales bacterium]MCM1072309.1 hypothetical protein [Bacteroides sp.]